MDLFTTMNILFDTRRGRQTGPVICRVGRRASHYMAGKNIIFNTRRGRQTGPVIRRVGRRASHYMAGKKNHEK